ETVGRLPAGPEGAEERREEHSCREDEDAVRREQPQEAGEGGAQAHGRSGGGRGREDGKVPETGAMGEDRGNHPSGALLLRGSYERASGDANPCLGGGCGVRWRWRGAMSRGEKPAAPWIKRE